MKYYVFDDEVYIKAEELIDFASKENNNKIEIKGRLYQSPQHGYWVSVDEEKRFYLWKCSECHTLFMFIDRYYYCPHCGAKMDAN